LFPKVKGYLNEEKNSCDLLVSIDLFYRFNIEVYYLLNYLNYLLVNIQKIYTFLEHI
jgi:hypothetical protein